MALILYIDTATEIATVGISNNNEVLGSVTNTEQRDHAAFLQPAIRDLLKKTGITFIQVEAISVTAGPGSYTGLRVGLASAKGLCYALNIPLITLGTLEVMALSSIKHFKNDDSTLYCPMIDARRMEVFTAVYNNDMEEIVEPSAIILDEKFFSDLLKTKKIIFSGSGAVKLKSILTNDNADFSDNKILPEALAELSYKNFQISNFASISLAEPAYIKDFYTP